MKGRGVHVASRLFFKEDDMRFWVVNAVRDVSTRTARATSPARHRFKQPLCDGRIRLVRKRPQPILPVLLDEYYDELYDLQDQGRITVREGTRDGPIHSFDPKKVEHAKAVRWAKVEHAQRRAALIKEGKRDEADALVLVLPSLEPPEEPVEETEELVEVEISTEPEPVVEESEPVVEELEASVPKKSKKRKGKKGRK
jgi:hypothetical protein